MGGDQTPEVCSPTPVPRGTINPTSGEQPQKKDACVFAPHSAEETVIGDLALFSTFIYSTSCTTTSDIKMCARGVPGGDKSTPFTLH